MSAIDTLCEDIIDCGKAPPFIDLAKTPGNNSIFTI